jgi:uncharacterized protein
LDYPHYNPNSDHRPLDDDELDALDQQLGELPEAMNIELLDGYLTGLLVSPRPLAELAGSDWLPAVWGGDADASSAAPFASQKQKKRLIMLVLRHLHDIDTRLLLAPQDWQPVFSVASADDLDLPAAADTADREHGDAQDDADLVDELADARDWCAGFLDACELDADGWEALFDDAELGPQLLPIAVLGGDADLGDDEDDDNDGSGKAKGTDDDEVDDIAAASALLADPLEVDRLSRAAAEVVLLLYRRRQAG